MAKIKNPFSGYDFYCWTLLIIGCCYMLLSWYEASQNRVFFDECKECREKEEEEDGNTE